MPIRLPRAAAVGAAADCSGGIVLPIDAWRGVGLVPALSAEAVLGVAPTAGPAAAPFAGAVRGVAPGAGLAAAVSARTVLDVVPAAGLAAVSTGPVDTAAAFAAAAPSFAERSISFASFGSTSRTVCPATVVSLGPGSIAAAVTGAAAADSVTVAGVRAPAAAGVVVAAADEFAVPANRGDFLLARAMCGFAALLLTCLT